MRRLGIDPDWPPSSLKLTLRQCHFGALWSGRNCTYSAFTVLLGEAPDLLSY